MSDLDRDLRALAQVVDLPGERDLVPAVLRRLHKQRYSGRWRRVAGVAALVLAVSLTATMAVPDARTAVLRFLGIKGATVIRVDELPPATSEPHELGEPVTLAEAERVAGFRPLLPALGPPDEVRIDRFSPSFVILLYGEPVRLRMLQFVGGAIEKLASVEQPVERVSVNGEPGIWVEGRHVVTGPIGLPRLAGSALLWEQDGLTLRLEGPLTKDEALGIARDVS